MDNESAILAGLDPGDLEKGASAASSMFQSAMADPALLATILGGAGIGGLAGGALSARARGDRDETRGKRRGRILRSALASAAAGAAAGGLGLAGMRSLGGALPADSKSPLAEGTGSPFGRLLLGGAGYAGASWTSRFGGSARSSNATYALNKVRKHLGVGADSPRGSSPINDLGELVRNNREKVKEWLQAEPALARELQRAGINPASIDDAFKSIDVAADTGLRGAGAYRSAVTGAERYAGNADDLITRRLGRMGLKDLARRYRGGGMSGLGPLSSAAGRLGRGLGASAYRAIAARPGHFGTAALAVLAPEIWRAGSGLVGALPFRRDD